MGFDVSSIELEDTATMTVKNARGDDDLVIDGAPVTIELYSPGSPQGVKALHQAGRSAQLRMFRAMRGESDPKDAENADREAAQKLAAFTKAISANLPLAPLQLYSNPRLVYIAKQAEDYLAKYANFSKASSAS